MKKIVLLVLVALITNISFAQEDFGPGSPGGGEFKMVTFGKLCKNITKEIDRAKCSQDQIKEYIALLKTPEIVQKKKLNVSTIINFGLNETGEIIDVQIKKSSGNTEIDNLCLEHVKKMPNWTAEINDNMVVSSSNLNLTFKFKYIKKTK